MNALRMHWQNWSAQFLARPRRERAILAFALLFGGGFLLFNFGIDTVWQKTRIAQAETLAARTDLLQQKAQLAAVQAVADPDTANRQRLAQLKTAMNAVNTRLTGFEQGMVSPTRMRGFLEDLLARNRGIELLELKTLPPEPVGTPLKNTPDANHQTAANNAENPTTPPADGIWQHGIELRLAGSYLDLLNYLTSLEALPQRLMWNRLELKTTTYPRNEMMLRVYTLSLDKDWLVM
jgi:MSHA biogenesis protein MshJ